MTKSDFKVKKILWLNIAFIHTSLSWMPRLRHFSQIFVLALRKSSKQFSKSLFTKSVNKIDLASNAAISNRDIYTYIHICMNIRYEVQLVFISNVHTFSKPRSLLPWANNKNYYFACGEQISMRSKYSTIWFAFIRPLLCNKE